MTLTTYIKNRGLTVRLVCQQLGITRQALSQYGRNYMPTAKTLNKIAQAMTELGAKTTVVDLVTIMYKEADNKKQTK